MTKDDTQEIERVRVLISKRLERVPDSVLGGSYQTTVDYKAAVTKANKFLAGKRSTLLSGQAVLGELNKFV